MNTIAQLTQPLNKKPGSNTDKERECDTTFYCRSHDSASSVHSTKLVFCKAPLTVTKSAKIHFQIQFQDLVLL